MGRRYRPAYGGAKRQAVPRAAIRRPGPRGDPGRDGDRAPGRPSRLPQRHRQLRRPLRHAARSRLPRRAHLPVPKTGDPVATSFLTPRTPEDLDKRQRACKTWADRSLGMLGRTPDYLNSALMALAASADWFAQASPGFGDNIKNYYEQVREDDLLCPHTLVPPQANRAVAASQQARGTLMAHIASEDDNGIVVRGARLLATIGPFADELLVFPSTLLRNTPEDKQYSFACAIPNDAPGLRYLAREPLDYGRPRPTHPLGSRFEESGAVGGV